MRFRASDIAAASGGDLVGPDVEVTSVSIDSRTIERGALFVPVVAERDGHDFVAAALAAGAAAYLTEREPIGGTAIRVADTGQALLAIGRVARDRHPGPVVGITGSVGKTSVKDLAIAAIAAGRSCHGSEHSFNNELGVPLTLANAPEGTEVLVVEMGARGLGHIRELCDIARPTIGIVTWVAAAHTSEFASLEEIADAKGELIECLPADGTAILNVDCDLVESMAERTKASVVTYGVDGMVAPEHVSLDAELRPSFDAVVDGEATPVTLAVHGQHQVSNALAALAAARSVGVPPAIAAEGLASAALSRWRMEVARTRSGATLINDAYNANATSTAAALRSLAALDADRRVAVLGLMAELGDRHDADHAAMAALCVALDVDLIAFREPAYGPEPLDEYDQVVDRLGPLGPRDAVLVKGSRVAGLETLAERLLAD